MPVRLRLRRLGRKGRPYYQIVAADSRSPRDGKYIEKVGVYNPVETPAHIEVDHDLALKWLKNGAQPSDTVRAILRYTGVNLKFALMKQGKDEATVEAMYQSWLAEKEASIDEHKASIKAKADKEAAERMERESKIREEKAAAIAAKNAPPVEETEEAEGEDAEAPVAEAEEAPAEEAAAEEAPAE